MRQVIVRTNAEAAAFCDNLEKELQTLFDDRDCFGIIVAVHEALANAIKHGHNNDQTQPVKLSFDILPGYFEIFIEDNGSGFDQSQVPDPCAAENLDSSHGRGLLLMRNYMTFCAHLGRGNVVRMVKWSSH